MEVIQSIHANSEVLATTFKEMTSLRAVFGKEVEVVPCDVEGISKTAEPKCLQVFLRHPQIQIQVG